MEHQVAKVRIEPVPPDKNKRDEDPGEPTVEPVQQVSDENFHSWLCRHRGLSGGWTPEDHLVMVKLTHRYYLNK